jgi:hypothetical protein
MTREDAIKKLPLFRLYGEDAQIGWLLDCLIALDLIPKLDDYETVLCRESADWDWWLKQSPEFKGTCVKLFRAAMDQRR